MSDKEFSSSEPLSRISQATVMLRSAAMMWSIAGRIKCYSLDLSQKYRLPRGVNKVQLSQITVEYYRKSCWL